MTARISAPRGGATTALKTAVRSLREHPVLAIMFLAATLAQGALQGAMIWALRGVLIALSEKHGAASSVLAVGSLGVFVLWLLRSGGVFAAQMFSAQLAHRVELE